MVSAGAPKIIYATIVIIIPVPPMFRQEHLGKERSINFIALLQGGVRTGPACEPGVGKAARTELAISR